MPSEHQEFHVQGIRQTLIRVEPSVAYCVDDGKCDDPECFPDKHVEGEFDFFLLATPDLEEVIEHRALLYVGTLSKDSSPTERALFAARVQLMAAPLLELAKSLIAAGQPRKEITSVIRSIIHNDWNAADSVMAGMLARGMLEIFGSDNKNLPMS